MMKRIYALAFAILLVHAVATAALTTFVVENHTSGQVYLQPEDTLGYRPLRGQTDTLRVDLRMPAYYRFVDKDYRFYPLFAVPGATMRIVCSDQGVQVSGEGKAETEFMWKHRFDCIVPEEIAPYSREWVRYNVQRLIAVDDSLRQSGLRPDFVAIHRNYLAFTFLNQRLNGLQTALTFGKESGQQIVLPDDYYQFLDEIQFDDSLMLCVPRWFNVMDKTMEEAEKQGYLAVEPRHYMRTYASRITDDRLRSHYLARLVDLSLRKGYYADVLEQWDEVKALVTDAEAAALLPALREKALGAMASDKLRLQLMPDFVAMTPEGKEIHLSDFRGKVVVVDFWFTGCVPCKAEMPYFDRLADAMKELPVAFLSVSLDTGDQLMATWHEMMRSRTQHAVCHVNIPNGFKSSFVKEIGLRAVPRIMLIDASGRVADTYAKRPSDPKLRKVLEEMCAVQ